MKFADAVIAIVERIPRGQVATYGQVAAATGNPRSARMVGSVLARSNQGIPWQRVINRHGMISIENMVLTKIDQAELLRRDGVKVELREGNYWVDLSRYLMDEDRLIQALEDHNGA